MIFCDQLGCGRSDRPGEQPAVFNKLVNTFLDRQDAAQAAASG